MCLPMPPSLFSLLSASIDMIKWFLPLLLFMWCIMFINLRILYHPCIPGMNPTRSWCMIFLMYCWMRFANILLRILASMFVSGIGLKFSFFVMSLSGLGIRMMLASETSLGVFHLLEFFEIIYGGWGLAPP